MGSVAAGPELWVQSGDASVEAEDFEGGEAELAAGGDGEGLEEVEVFEGVVGVERDELAASVAAGGGDGGGDDAEVLAGVVGADVEEAGSPGLAARWSG